LSVLGVNPVIFFDKRVRYVKRLRTTALSSYRVYILPTT